MFMLRFTPSLLRHLVAAVTWYCDQLRRNGTAVPPDLLAFRRALETELGRTNTDKPGQTWPVLARPTGSADAGDMDLAITFAEAGRRIGVSERTIRRRVAAGDLRSVTLGGARRVNITDLQAFAAGASVVHGAVAGPQAARPEVDLPSSSGRAHPSQARPS